MTDYGKKTVSKEDRENHLRRVWEESLPCHGCPMGDICRFKNAVRRVDYPSEVFHIDIRCKVRGEYTRVQPADCLE